MGARRPLSRARRVVVKVGSGLVTTPGEGPSGEAITRLAADLAGSRELVKELQPFGVVLRDLPIKIILPEGEDLVDSPEFAGMARSAYSIEAVI